MFKPLNGVARPRTYLFYMSVYNICARYYIGQYNDFINANFQVLSICPIYKYISDDSRMIAATGAARSSGKSLML